VSGFIDWKTVPHVVAAEKESVKYLLHHGDIVLARTGASTGASAFVSHPPSAVFASYLVRLQPNPHFDARFLSYYLKSDAFWEFIRGVLGDKSAQPNASASTMTKAPLRAPRDKHEQSAIGDVLGSLDDRSEQLVDSSNAFSWIVRI
jgi:type I restriction enzyme S subunit